MSVVRTNNVAFLLCIRLEYSTERAINWKPIEEWWRLKHKAAFWCDYLYGCCNGCRFNNSKNQPVFLKLAFALIVSVPSKAQWRRDRRMFVYPMVSERYKIGECSQRYGHSSGRWKFILLYRNGITTRLCCSRTCYVVINFAHFELQGFEEFHV